MDEIGDELNDKSENDNPVNEPSELTNQTEELNETNDDVPEIFSETDEIDDDLPEIFDEPDEIDDDLPEIFSESGELDDDLPEIFDEPDELDDDLPEIFSESGEGNESNEAEEPDQSNPNEGSENSNESDQNEMRGDDESNYIPYEYGVNFEQEGYSEGFYDNFNAESMNTVLLSENLIYAALKEYIELMVENEADTEVQGEQVEVDNSKEEISELEEFLNEERERIRLEQQQAEFDEGIESGAEPIDNKEEIEQEVGIQENVSEEMVPNNEEEVENLEMKLEEELQSVIPNERLESGKVEEIEEKNEEPQPHGIEENIEGREKEFKVDDGKYEQRQSEIQIEEKQEIESEPIAHGKELEFIEEEHEEKEDHDEFIKERELSQINQELEVIQEINSNETEVLANGQEEELEQDHISPYREKLREIEEYKNYQQELEEILEQTRKIEQEVLIEGEQEQEKSEKNIEENYEKAKKLYNQETGKRPIYANNETKGFKQWLEQKKKSEVKQEHFQIQEDNSEVRKKKIEQESDEGINPKLQPLLKEIIENFNFLENLTTKFKELYGSAQNNQISKTEKKELKLLINSLKKVGPTKFMLFARIKAIKRYANKEKFSDKAHLNHALNHFFTKFLQKNLILTYENVENKEKVKLKELINSGSKKILMNQINKSGEIVRISKFKPIVLIKIIEQLGGNLNVTLDIKDEIYLQKKKNYTYSSRYSDGDVEFWIELYKVKYYGRSWPAVFNFINECNNRFNLKIDISHYYNDIIPIVKTYFKQNSLNYEEFLIKYGIRKSKQPPTDETVQDWIKTYQDRELGGSISAIRKHLENLQGYTLGETTIRRHIKKFFLNGKYTDYFGTVLSYEEWIKIYKRKYYREVMPLDPKTQSHEYILVHNIRKNQYKRVFIKDLENPELLENMDELQILGISNNLQPEKVNINRLIKGEPQESLEIICSHGSVMISPDQFLFTIDDDCNIIKIKGRDLKVGTPILMPRILKINSNNEPLDLINCGKLIFSNNAQYIEQYGKRAYRFIKKNAKLGAIIGQYEAEGTFPSKYQPGTTISVSVDKDYIQKLQKIITELFGLEFQIFTRRVTECKNCRSKTIERGNQNICPKCDDGIYNEYYELRTKTKLAKAIFTEGLGLKHAYSYLKEIPSFLYNSPVDCEKGFILSYFKGDGSERDYRNKGGSFDLNFETTSRRLVFGLNVLMKKLGVIMSVSEHNPPSSRPNSKKLYSMVIRGSSNFEKLKQYFDNLPEVDYTTSDIKTSVNTQVLIRKLNLELQKIYDISMRELSKNGIIPKNAQHIAIQLKRKTNLSEVLLLKTLDGLKNEELVTPLVKKLEQVFRKNTFTRIKKIRSSKTNNQTYKIVVDGIGYCSGTAFVYIKSEENTKEK